MIPRLAIAIFAALLSLTSCQPGDVSCNFEDGFCGWKITPAGDFTWRLGGDGVTGKNHPSTDHTTLTTSGHYAFINSTMETTNGKARLISPRIGADEYCLDFWYYQFGHQDGSITLVLSEVDGDNKHVSSRTLYSSHSNGKRWRHDRTTAKSPTDFVLSFESSDVTKYRFVIALDDVAIQHGQCQ